MKECFHNTPDMDFTWFWDAVQTFNKITSPDGIDKELQHDLIVEEANELLSAETKEEVLDAIVDTMFTLAPVVDRDDFFNDSAETMNDQILGNINSCINRRMYHLTTSYLFDIIANFKGDVQGAAKEIVRSNMSKFPVGEMDDLVSGTTAMQTERWYSEVKGQYIPLAHKLVTVDDTTYNVFYNADTGKVVKPYGYFSEPDLTPYI